jgi:hypothetical protein
MSQKILELKQERVVKLYIYDHIDVVARGAFFSLTAGKASELIKKMVSNQGWRDDHLQTCKRGMHTVN